MEFPANTSGSFAASFYAGCVLLEWPGLLRHLSSSAQNLGGEKGAVMGGMGGDGCVCAGYPWI